MVARTSVEATVRLNLNDAGVFYTPEDLTDSIQDCYEEVTAFSGCIIKATTVQFQTGKVYYDFVSLIPDYLAVVAIFNSQTKRWMYPVSLRQLREIRYDWELAIGNPFAFWPVNFRYIAVYPRANNSNGKFFVFYRAIGLSTDPLLNIPDEHQQVLEDYVTADLLEQAEEFSKASRYFSSYMSGLSNLKRTCRQIRLPDKTNELASLG